MSPGRWTVMYFEREPSLTAVGRDSAMHQTSLTTNSMWCVSDRSGTVIDQILMDEGWL